MGEDPKVTRVVRGALDEPGFASLYSERMYRLRHDVFHERLRWDVTVREGLEYDRFDDADSTYMVTTTPDDVVLGGWRLRPTTTGYMLRDVFGQLLHGQAAPADPHVWEISRFALGQAPRTIGNPQGKKRSGCISLSNTARLLVADAVNFAKRHDITRYVLVTSLALERLLASSGLRLHRFGPPARIGRELAVACWVDIDAHTERIARYGKEPNQTVGRDVQEQKAPPRDASP